MPQSKAAGLTLAGDWTSRKTTTSPQAAAAQKTQNRMSTITAASGAAEDTRRTFLELLGGSSDPLEQRIRIHAAVAVVALLISLWGGL